MTSFVIHSYSSLTCKGSLSTAATRFGDCVADPRIVPADPSNLAEYRDTWVDGRHSSTRRSGYPSRADERPRCSPLSTRWEQREARAPSSRTSKRTWNHLRVPRHAHRRRARRQVHRRPRRDVRARKGSRGGHTHECQTGQASSTCDVITGTSRTRPRATPRANAPTPTVITIPVDAAWLTDLATDRERAEEIWDAAENCAPGKPRRRTEVFVLRRAPHARPDHRQGERRVRSWWIWRTATAETRRAGPCW